MQFSKDLQGIIHDGFSICHIFVHGKGGRAVSGQKDTFECFDTAVAHYFCATRQPGEYFSYIKSVLAVRLKPLYLLQPVVLININDKTSSNSAVINESSQTRNGEGDTQTVPVAGRNLTDVAGVKRLNLRRR